MKLIITKLHPAAWSSGVHSAGRLNFSRISLNMHSLKTFQIKFNKTRSTDHVMC